MIGLLSTPERETATQISRSLTEISENARKVPFSDLKKNAYRQLQNIGFQVDYIAIADATNLRELDAPIPGQMVVLAAAKLGEIRLIDNMLI